MKIVPLGSSGSILTCYRFLTGMCHFQAKTELKTICKVKNSSKQLILSDIFFHFAQIQTFECKIRPFSDLFAQQSLISDLSEKIGPFRYFASVWFLTSAMMVPQARLWCLRLFSCLSEVYRLISVYDQIIIFFGKISCPMVSKDMFYQAPWSITVKMGQQRDPQVKLSIN